MAAPIGLLAIRDSRPLSRPSAMRSADSISSDGIPWVVGYSGGKDSSATLQLVWLAIRELPPEERTKTVHVISTDTLVEQPLVAAWVDASLAKMRVAAREQGLPFVPHKLTPEIENTFWVNLIGKGYPAPRNKFRWCTERLKIQPSNKFIREVVRSYGEAILVLGTRKAESQRRAATMAQARREEGPRPAHAQRELAQLAGLHADRGLEQRRRLAVPDAGEEPLGARQQVAAGHVPGGDRRGRVPAGRRHLDAELRHQPVRLLGLHRWSTRTGRWRR